MRPEVGTQTRFKKKLSPAKFRYDESPAPSMEWDEQNAARNKGEWLLALIDEAAALPAPHRSRARSCGHMSVQMSGKPDDSG
jgi:adenine-specific DNA-methyltransferase